MPTRQRACIALQCTYVVLEKSDWYQHEHQHVGIQCRDYVGHMVRVLRVLRIPEYWSTPTTLQLYHCYRVQNYAPAVLKYHTYQGVVLEPLPKKAARRSRQSNVRSWELGVPAQCTMVLDSLLVVGSSTSQQLLHLVCSNRALRFVRCSLFAILNNTCLAVVFVRIYTNKQKCCISSASTTTRYSLRVDVLIGFHLLYACCIVLVVAIINHYTNYIVRQGSECRVDSTFKQPLHSNLRQY